jgi:glycosyltransferase involved in cell wall biosynthesis
VQADDRPSTARAAVRRLPASVRPAVGDAAAWREDRAMAARLRRIEGRPRAIVQFHHRFQRAPQSFARAHGIPFALRIEALEVREESAWGVRRPGYGRAVERWGERDLIRGADLVAPVSRELDRALAGIGIPSGRRSVVPNGVDVDAIAPGPADEGLRRSLGLDGRFVVGWVGGFRAFHGLGLVPAFVDALARLVPSATLCLVGAGPLRADLERVAAATDNVIVTGPVAHEDIALWLRTFDAGVLFGEEGAFHYAPLKLLELMAAGRPVVAPAVGDLAQDLTNGHDALVVRPGDAAALATAVAAVAEDPALAARLGTEARRTVERDASWEARARALMAALDARTPMEVGRRRG